MEFQLISSDDLFKLNVMVQDKLNSGWELYGSPSVALGASVSSIKNQSKLFAQAVIRKSVMTPEPAATTSQPEDSEGNRATFVYESPDDSPDHFKEVKIEQPEPTPEPAAAAEIAPAKEVHVEETADEMMEASIVQMAKKAAEVKIEQPEKAKPELVKEPVEEKVAVEVTA